METKFNHMEVEYSSPKIEVLGILPEAVLCQSDKDEVTLNTGSSWGEDPDAAEW